MLKQYSTLATLQEIADVHNLLYAMLDGDAEMMWAKHTLGGIKPIYLCSFYRPPDGLKDPILRLTAALNKLYDKSSQPHNIILAGDFNFPNLLWEGGIGSVDPNPTYGPEANHLFIETTKDYGLEQLVSQPTRGNHIRIRFSPNHSS